MIGKIEEIIDNSVKIKLNININEQPNLVNVHVVFEDGDNKVVGEIVNVNKKILKANVVGVSIVNPLLYGPVLIMRAILLE